MFLYYNYSDVFHHSLCFITGEYGIVYKGRLAKGFNRAFSEVIAVKTLKGTLHTTFEQLGTSHRVLDNK